MKQTLVLGSPGTGKTTRMLNVMEQALAEGMPPNRIAFTTFTRAAANEAKTRAKERFNLSDSELPYFRTLHSLAFNQLGCKRSDILAEEHLGELAELTGELVQSVGASAEAPASRRSADGLMTIDHYARTTRQDLKGAWYDHGGDTDWHRLLRFSEAYRLYKIDRGLTDFTDLLADYVRAQPPPVPVDLAIVDEAQDLTLLQWAVAGHAFSGAAELWVAGDDDQQIHKWAGAAGEHLLTLGYDREVLPLSHRLPREIFQLSQEVIHQVGHRYAKDVSPADRSGAVNWIARPDEADLSAGTWLLLSRTRAQLAGLVELARGQGVAYSLKGAVSVDPEHVRAIQGYEALRAGKRAEGADCQLAMRLCGVSAEKVLDSRTYTAKELGFDAGPIWHDALIRLPLDIREYYLMCLRRDPKSLTTPPRVRIDTIHGSKGAEAEHVLLTTDLTWQTQRGYELDPDSEHRVFYVGITRASQSLWLVAPRGAYRYPL